MALSLAALQRLGRADEAASALDEFVPAAGQGALALEARADDGALAERLRDQAPAGCVVSTEGTLGAVLTEQPNPFAVFGGLAG